MATVLVPLAQGCEELEAVTIIDLLRRAGIEVITASLDEKPVRASRGTVLLADAVLDEVLDRNFDMMVLPGGLPGADHLNEDRRIHQLIEKMTRANHYVGAICAAPKVLARAGILKGKKATSYPGAIPKTDMEGILYQEQAVVQDGMVFTSRGPGTAMDFALTLIETLAGREKRDEVEKALLRA